MKLCSKCGVNPQVLYAARLLAFLAWRDDQTEVNWETYAKRRDALMLVEVGS